MNKIFAFLVLLIPSISHAYTLPSDVTISQINKYNCVQVSNKNVQEIKGKIQQDKTDIIELVNKINTVKFDLYMDKLAMNDKLRDARAQLDRDIISSMVDDNLLDTCIKNTISEIRLGYEKDNKHADLQQYIRDQDDKIALSKKMQSEMMGLYLNLNTSNSTLKNNDSSGALSFSGKTISENLLNDPFKKSIKKPIFRIKKKLKPNL